MRLRFRFRDGSCDQGKVCGIIDYCGPDVCRNENCVDEVNDCTCDCDADYELMLQVNGSVCVAKECDILSRTRFSGTDVNVSVKVRRRRGSSEKMNSRSATTPIEEVRCDKC